MSTQHSFTGTYDGRAGDCLNCEANPYELIANLTYAAGRVLPALLAYADGTDIPRKHHVKRWALELEAAKRAAEECDDDTFSGCPICDGGNGTPCNSHFGV